MTSLEGLRAARNSYTVALHGLLRDHGRDPYQLFLLVEGKDGDYYRPRVSSVFSGCRILTTFRNIQGKKNIKDLIRAIRRNADLREVRYAVFLDRDFEQDFNEMVDDCIFITCGYSIENYYTHQDVLQEVVRSALFADQIHLDASLDEINDIVSLYIAMREKFHRSISLFNQWAWVQRHVPREGKINLDAFDIEMFFDFDFEGGNVTKKYVLDDLNALAPERVPVTHDELADAECWFARREAGLSNRGKQEIAFLYWFIQESLSRAAFGLQPFRSKTRCSKRISRKEIISELSAYAITPPALIEFLSSIKYRLQLKSPLH